MEEIKSKIWHGSFSVATDARGMASGLAILWHPETIHLTNLRTTHFSISADFQVCNFEVRGILTNVYGPRVLS